MAVRGRSSIVRLIVVMAGVVCIGVFVARFYYGRLNRTVDPRIRAARELYEKYNGYAAAGDYHSIFSLLDSIEKIYRKVPHYRGSFELGVVDNNRAAALLTLALNLDSIPLAANPFPGLEPDSLVDLAEVNVTRAIQMHKKWYARHREQPGDEIRRTIGPEFTKGLEGDEDYIAACLDSRVKEIEQALAEHGRRLSVCHTNLGLIYRHREEYLSAVRQYETALNLWDRNLDAENNLNILLNKPLKKRNLLQKLFPPERDR